MLLQNLLKKSAQKILCVLSLSLALGGCSNTEEKKEKSTVPFSINKKKPNILVILTDQERYPMHWPEGWAEKNLPSYNRLKKNGLTFHKAYAASSACTPSRAVMQTSQYYPVNKVPITPSLTGLPTADALIDIGGLLKQHTNYEVVWKGKWHLSPPLDGGFNWTEKDSANLQKRYTLYGWNPPDAGTAVTEIEPNTNGTTFNGLFTLGGGYANNDLRYLFGTSKTTPNETPGWGEGVLDYLKKVGATKIEERKPFCLFVSFVNPHDVWVYPTAWEKAGYKKEEFADLGIALPSNYADDLTSKPSVQLKARNAYNEESPLKDAAAEKEYVNFYAYLHKKVDEHIVTILEALDVEGLTEDTLIIRTADHGELGMSHGMREKSYTVYEEMIHIPLVISNPQLFPEPQSTDALYCHLDLLPTLAELAGVPDFTHYGKGVSVVPLLKNTALSGQESILFAFDDIFFLPDNTLGNHIRALIEKDWIYAVYYAEDGSHFEYELYNLKKDPGQLDNLLYKDVSPATAQEAHRLHQKLTERIDQTGALPAGFPWPL